MDNERRDGGGEAEMEDEFACAGILRGSLTSLHATVERIFAVVFVIGEDDSLDSNNGQIWLKLQGRSEHVTAAKLFVKGIVNQEEQQEVSYPEVLHCVFCGARGLFMDCLIRSTSAHILVGSTGSVLISGLAEPVVRAYSLIMDLVERYESTQSRRSDIGDRVTGESLDSRRAFKTLVEKWEDRHILDLLVLPGSVKEILLDLLKDSGHGSDPGPAVIDRHAGARSLGNMDGIWESTSNQWVEGITAGLTENSKDSDHFLQTVGTQGRAEGADERLISSPQEVGEVEQLEQATLGNKGKEGQGEEEEMELELSVGNKEFRLLLKFFTAMGYTEDVVKRVLARTGPKEASQILDLVQQEQDRSDQEKMTQHCKNMKSKALNQNEGNHPCETEHREEELKAEGQMLIESNGNAEKLQDGEAVGATGNTMHSKEGSSAEEKDDSEDSFVLGVLKKAAASCGYMEQNVAKAYNMFPDGSTHQMILELQKERGKGVGSLREEPREMDDVVLEKEEPKYKPVEKREFEGRGWVELPAADMELVTLIEKPKQLPNRQHTLQPKQQQQPSKSKPQHQIILPEVKGPPMPMYPPLTNFQTNQQHDQNNYQPDPSTYKQNSPNHNFPNPKTQSSNSLKRGLQAQQPTFFSQNDSSLTKGSERGGFMDSSSVVVTGQQRFLEGLQTGFNLQLTDKPGDPKLRTIIIDGSNVAMSHGLTHFFSCRGIALAVQHFWDRGHRHISVFLPQWRQKSDPRIKEQHYLTELQKLGLLSYTPSREVQGKRIASYDDRFMLQLAQKTDGVIVTNDNLRDLSDESTAWRDIIKKRLLQYLFVGDHFMVPDDPLGKGGPHLDYFLRSDHRTSDKGNHSFAGLATTFPSSKPPRSQTEVLNFRDRTFGGNRGRGRGKGNLGSHGHAQVFRPDRSAEETASLREQLCQVFLGQEGMVALVLQSHPAVTDINVLSDLMLQQD